MISVTYSSDTSFCEALCLSMYLVEVLFSWPIGYNNQIDILRGSFLILRSTHLRLSPEKVYFGHAVSSESGKIVILNHRLVPKAERQEGISFLGLDIYSLFGNLLLKLKSYVESQLRELLLFVAQ